MTKTISFEKEPQTQDFFGTVREQVHLYLKQNNLSPKANRLMILQTCGFLGVAALIYTAIIGGWAKGLWLLPAYGLLGLIGTFCGFNICHDALHGAYSFNPLINRALGFILDVFGVSSYYWKKGHTFNHHTFTNIRGHDVDIEGFGVLSLCPETPHRPIFRFQHLYAPFLYAIHLTNWIYISDTKRIWAVLRKKQSESKPIPRWEFFSLLAFKVIHVSLFLGLPLLFSQAIWWEVVLGYLTFLMVASISILLIFQLAHIVENVVFPLPNEEGKMEMSFAQHQLVTTSNFATHSWLTTFLTGGLNFQVEHHLFPHLSHSLLPQIAPIVKSTAQQFGFPYHEQPSFFAAVRSHFKTLKRLGQKL